MKRSGSEEIPVDTSWRVFNSLQKRYSAHLRNRIRQRLTPSYEEFLKEIDEEEKKNNELGERNSFSLNENESYNNYNELNSIPSSNNSDNDEDEWISVNSSSNDEDNLDSNSEYDENVNSKNKKVSGSSGESSEGDDEALDDFIKKLTLDLEELDATEEGNCDKFHYTSLTDYLRKASKVEDGNLRDTEKEEKDLQGESILKLSAQERLPLVQALDAIADINKVLKAGKLTSRMERIIEYKQDHPFLDGYDEDELGCCPWLVYKVEKMINRFFASQWPN